MCIQLHTVTVTFSKEFMMNKVFWYVERIFRCINLHLSDSMVINSERI